MIPLSIFYLRLQKIGIQVSFVGNYPWVYLDTVNGKKVTEKFHSEHGFVIGFSPLKPSEKSQFTDIGEIFKIIRKYK